MSNEATKRDLVLPQGTYAYMQDVTKGVIKTYTGPTVINPTAQERPVVYDAAKGTFKTAASLDEALCISPIAAEGHYIILRNPAKGNRHPDEGSAQPSAEREIGRTINVPGPTTFALWPGETASVVAGHHLRSNQYLLVRVYNEDEARKNWTKAVVKPAAVETTGTSEGAETVSTPSTVTATPPPDLTVGKLLIIRGTEVSFYIPPTGVEVVATDADFRNADPHADRYVRDALTLERLEYALLVDENGKKRYERGPQVVFPLPTERFVDGKDEQGKPSKKSRAVELNEIQGLHIKIISPYTDEITGKTYKEGDELFVTGKDTQIYFPREEHSYVKYDGKSKHFATAVPSGEARYVMDRLTGVIETKRGPAMLMPDPRTKVFVRRTLTEKEAALWYPGNQEVAEYNRQLRALRTNIPSTRQGAMSEGDLERAAKRSLKSSGGVAAAAAAPVMYASMNSLMDSSLVSGDQDIAGDEFSRSSTYNQPRELHLNTKFSGAPAINVFTGYAILVVSKTGGRRVEVGPKTVLLDYDETLEALSLSTGKPKTTDRLHETVYLRKDNNKVSDVVQVETADHVQVQLSMSYLCNFEEGEPLKWFAVENYVKHMCDHIRSVLKGQVRKLPVEKFYAESTDIIRNIILGAKDKDADRPGMFFEENGLRVADVEVLKVHLQDENIRTMLEKAQQSAVKANIDLSTMRRDLEVLQQKENITRQSAEVQAATARLKNELEIEQEVSRLSVTLAKLANELKQQSERRKVAEAEQETKKFLFEADLAQDRAVKEQKLAFAAKEQDQRIALLKAEADSIVQRFGAAQGQFSEALLQLSRNETLVKVAEAWGVAETIAGESLSDTLQRLFNGTPLKPLIEKITTQVATNGDASKKIVTPASIS